MAAKKRRRNPPDSTLRNVRASAKRNAKTEARVSRLEARVRELERSNRRLVRYLSA